MVSTRPGLHLGLRLDRQGLRLCVCVCVCTRTHSVLVIRHVQANHPCRLLPFPQMFTED